MAYNPNLHHRRSIRLREWDYSGPGGYFVTICSYRRESMFGEIRNGRMDLNSYGEIVQQSWVDLPKHYHNILLDEFVIMPNHVHGIIVIVDDIVVDNTNSAVGASLRLAPTEIRHDTQPAPTERWNAMNHRPVSEIVRAFKSFSARRINGLRDAIGVGVWQRNYYERIIRNEKELRRVREYIAFNPSKWAFDEENPENGDGAGT